MQNIDRETMVLIGKEIIYEYKMAEDAVIHLIEDIEKTTPRQKKRREGYQKRLVGWLSHYIGAHILMEEMYPDHKKELDEGMDDFLYKLEAILPKPI